MHFYLFCLNNHEPEISEPKVLKSIFIAISMKDDHKLSLDELHRKYGTDLSKVIKLVYFHNFENSVDMELDIKEYNISSRASHPHAHKKSLPVTAPMP